MSKPIKKIISPPATANPQLSQAIPDAPLRHRERHEQGQHRQVYYDLLDRVRTEGDWEAWVDFFLEGVEATALGAVDAARRLVTLFDDDTRRIQQTGRIAANALRVLAALRQRPLLTLPQLCQLSAMDSPTAEKMQEQEREAQREFLERESHYVWGKRYLSARRWAAAAGSGLDDPRPRLAHELDSASPTFAVR